MFTTFKIRLSALLVSLCLNQASAHPHNWVNLTSDFVINEHSELVEVRQRWIFDTLYSAVLLDDLNKLYPDRQLALKHQADQIVTNLSSMNYYSHLKVGPNPIDIGKPYKWNLSTVETNNDEVLVLEMLFKVQPAQLNGANIQWSVYDPTYYVAMRHDEIGQVRIINHSTAECEPNLVEAEATEEQFMYAASLDKTETDTDGLGRLFAQTVSILCL